MKRWFLLMLAACGDNGSKAVDAPVTPVDEAMVDMPIDANPLATLQGTGLCDDPGCMTINSGIREYAPRFQLYADGATKRRWIELPAGTQIDTTDMDHWVFPVGTKMWKEFTRGGVRVETRFIEKRLADDENPLAWFYISYEWNAAQDATTAVSTGKQNANGTDHDIPSRANCKDCHDSLKPSRVLGFQAIQLDFNSNLLDLEDLITENLLTTAPGGSAGNRFPLPGAQLDIDALGYFHANCGHCHNTTSPNHDVTPMELRLEIPQLTSVQTTAVFTTAVRTSAAACSIGTGAGCADVPFTDNGIFYDKLIVPNDVANSGLIVRMNVTNNKLMPKIGTEVADPDGGLIGSNTAVLINWINTL